MRRLRVFLRDLWQLATPYFVSEEWMSAWGLLIPTIGLTLFLVYLNVMLNHWNGAWFDSLQHKDRAAFTALLFTWEPAPDQWLGVLPGFCWIAAVYILAAVYQTYLRQWLEIRWRRWMTDRFLNDWMRDRAYYIMSLTGGGAEAPDQPRAADNPDQRIAEDVRDFVRDALLLTLDFINNLVTLFSFLSILWALSGAVTLLGVRIPGYMFWVALIYAVIGTGLTHLVGLPLVRLSFLQQRYEADFRFALVRLRENVEGVALYGGEQEEKAQLHQRFGAVVLNWWGIMRRTKWLNTLVDGYQQVAVVFPFVVAAPRYFSGAIELGGLTRTAGAFGQVQSALSWFVSSYASLAGWRATMARLAGFERGIRNAQALTGGPLMAVADQPGARGLRLDLPDGGRLIEAADLAFAPGQVTAIGGRSGSGKSTLFRALAGIWPFGGGVVNRPAGQVLFLPQRPYIPLGTLRHAVSYPADPARFSDAAIRTALDAAGLGAIGGDLDAAQNWAQRLSGGEQQRLAIARALLLRPDYLFMDEATASLDPAAEQALYQALRRDLPGTGIITVTHRPLPDGLADRVLRLERDTGAAGAVVEAASSP